jgi:DNA-binding NarL/FixJ family response regulator
MWGNPDGHSLAPAASLTGMTISLVLVDDHPAVRTGLRTLLDDEPDLQVTATAATGRDGFSAIAELQPPVAVVDFHLPDEDGLTLCLRTRALPKPPRVIVYSALASARLAVLATVAGATVLISKSARPEELLAAIRADGPTMQHGDGLSPDALREAGAQLEHDDLAILGMLVHGIPPSEIAATLTMDERWLLARRWAMLERLAGKPARRPTARSLASAPRTAPASASRRS